MRFTYQKPDRNSSRPLPASLFPEKAQSVRIPERSQAETAGLK